MYYSVKMRASKDRAHEDGGKHISGAERIVNFTEIPEVCQQLAERAITHENGQADFINIKVELVKSNELTYSSSLPIFQIKAENYQEGEEAAKSILELAGITGSVTEQSWQYLIDGGMQGHNLRGALVVDGQTGEIYNPDFKGIRSTRMDLTKEAEAELNEVLRLNKLDKSRLKEALVLATKVAAAPNAWCELCFSDNPQYTTGYVAVRNWGYFRIPNIKPPHAKGGRVFLVNGNDFSWQKYLDFLTKKPILINNINKKFYHDLYIKDLSIKDLSIKYFQNLKLGEGIISE
jgi:6-carboxyhexanoate--CoA ligase